MKIVVRGTNWIGDAVMTVPALRRLRTAFPKAHITLHSREWAEGLFRDADFIDALLPIEKRTSRITSVRGQASALRSENFDVGIVFPNSFETALVARLGGTQRRFGYTTQGRSFLFSDPVAVPEWKLDRHEVFYYLNLVEAVIDNLGGRNPEPGSEPDPSIVIPEVNRLRAGEFLRGFAIDTSKMTVAIAAGSKNSRAKRWPSERFAAVADDLVRQMNANVILVGAPDEADISASVVSHANEKLLDITGKTSLADAAAILSIADLVICNDMGLAHLAPAVGTPTIVIFGPTDPITTRPFAPGAHVIRVDVDCSPCMLRDCPIDHRCMTRISADQVFQKARDILGTDLRK